MRRTGIGIAVVAGVLLAAAAASGQTAEELVEKNIRARGGLEKMKSVKSMRMTGSMALGGESAPTVLEFKRPGRLRWEFTLDGQTAIQAYDGTAGWAIMPFEGKTEPEKMPAEGIENFKRQADMDGPLVDYKAKGNRIELLGKGTAGGRDAWQLKVTAPDGEQRVVFLDAETGLQVKTVARKTVDGNEVEVVSVIGDYRDVDGLKLPHFFESSVTGVPETQSMKFDRIELNVPLEDSRFGMPKARAPSPPAVAPTPSVS